MTRCSSGCWSAGQQDRQQKQAAWQLKCRPPDWRLIAGYLRARGVHPLLVFILCRAAENYVAWRINLTNLDNSSVTVRARQRLDIDYPAKSTPEIVAPICAFLRSCRLPRPYRSTCMADATILVFDTLAVIHRFVIKELRALRSHVANWQQRLPGVFESNIHLQCPGSFIFVSMSVPIRRSRLLQKMALSSGLSARSLTGFGTKGQVGVA